MMFAESYRKAFNDWWFYHYMKNLWGFTQKEMEEISDYKPGSPFVEGAKTRAFNQVPFVDQNDVSGTYNFGDPGDEDDGKKK